MASNDGSLVKEAIMLLDKLSEGKQCLDDFIEDAAKDLQNMDAQHKKFILDVVSGCTEHKKLLDVVVNVFYGQNGRWLSRGDRSQFVIICYLTTFVLDDIGLQRFSNIVKSQDIKKMHTFLNFFFTHLTTWIQEEWNHIYDAACVEEQWIGPLLRWRPNIDILMDQLALKMSCGNQVKKIPIKTTKPQEFCLTKPKPRPLPMPELIPQQEKCKPVPNSTYRAPKEMQIIKEIKQENHQKTKELLNEANMTQFRCGNPQKSERTRRVMFQIQKDLDSKLQFNSFQPSEPPSSNKTKNCPVKLNGAAILRQRALRNRKEEEELQRVERLTEGEGEDSSFVQWQKNMREMDLHEELAKIEQRRLEGRISHKEAAIARINIMESNQKASQLKKEETAQLMREYAEKRLQEEKELRDLVQQVAEGHKNSKMAKEKLHKFKQSIVREVSEQSQALLRQALEEAQAELSRKFQTILEIRAIESLPHIRVKNFDDTETAGHELLGEMSIVELKLRLAHLKEVEQTEQQKKREHILEVTHKKKELLLEEVELNNLHMRAMAQAAAIRKEKERKASVDLQQKVAQDKRVLAMQKKLEEKKQEQRRLEQIKSSKAKTAEKTTEQAGTRDKKTMTAEEICESMVKNLEQLIQRAF
ncbi:cilia- and flagella-associated protein 99 isoform X2 [Hippoglossus hippoglossus]|uniref:cilia- and flagella-associated protein 99 isoform X1 n=1 Tax=Hippoglossus hippoglossus TaxID=8267 RepID=UPI00148C166E|nr:cilia- and flagella-associated protein 99 isoform X1 [Hippoglossus hippoglossus]XP_034432760.1 cilia- and flagella-associated protein 99 isoform X2 [Hippoglossus hippoglossus]